MKRDKELLLRWSEMNIFSPIFRTHEGNRPQDNAQFNDEGVIDEFAENSRIFYELKNYRKDVEKEYQENGTPMIRPLFMHYDDEEIRTNKREYLFGKDILVSPVLRPNENEHNVFLPEGNWVQFFTGKEYKAGKHKVPSPLGTPIAFYNKDSKYASLFIDITKNHKK